MFETLLIILQASWLIFFKFLFPVAIGTVLVIIYLDRKHPLDKPYGTHECDNEAHKQDSSIDWE